jgi:hypothetical protein
LPTANIGNVFLKNSNETLWEMPGANDKNPTGEAANFIPGSQTVRPTYALTNQLLSAFETGDIRKSTWLGKNTVSGIDYWYPAKYKQNSITANGVSTESQIVFRLAELYLIRLKQEPTRIILPVQEMI